MPNFVSIYSRLWVIKLIRLYQKTLSFDHGFFKFLYPHGFCRFKPTCSEYTIESIEKFGLIYGGFKAFWRVARCNPWSKGGYDPVSPLCHSRPVSRYGVNSGGNPEIDSGSSPE